MQFLYHSDAAASELEITDETYKYLFRVRRFSSGKVLAFRNLKDSHLYHYKIETIEKKKAYLSLESVEEDDRKELPTKHIIWCVIDTKVMEKTLPMLNQLGISKITFLYCERSQKNFKIDLVRLEKILINSCQQCGRSRLMEIEVADSLEEVSSRYPQMCVMDFGGEQMDDSCESIMIGCEGGFSEDEREWLSKYKKVAIKSSSILKSETAALVFASKGLI